MEAEDQRSRRGSVWRSVRQITADLHQIQIPHAVVGALAAQHHGYVGRSTKDVDLLIASDADVRRIHDRLLTRGYSRPSPTRRHIRDDVTHVRIEFLVAGEFPGDGKPKSVRFPHPDTVAETAPDGLRFINLRSLIELKLASAKSAAHRIKDRADVLELIHIHGLKADYAEQLDEYVRDEFRTLAALPPPSEPD
jgi:hypothetical protein